MAATFGRGAMTNGWVDIKNADVVFVMGGNPAENHPCGFKWAMEAKKTAAVAVSQEARRRVIGGPPCRCGCDAGTPSTSSGRRRRSRR